MTASSSSAPSPETTRPTPPLHSDNNNSALLNDFCEKATAWWTSTGVSDGLRDEDDLARYSIFAQCCRRSEPGYSQVDQAFFLLIAARSLPEIFWTRPDKSEQETSNGQ